MCIRDSVYTTVNVQHLESLNDLVSSITGIAVNERIPDHVFDRAKMCIRDRFKTGQD